jgi:hypothetical protein
MYDMVSLRLDRVYFKCFLATTFFFLLWTEVSAITLNVIVMVNDNTLLESVRRQVEDHSCTKMNYWAVFFKFSFRILS